MSDISIKAPLISICIPTYNRAKKVFNLVNELLNYEGDKIEIIVLDNCSTDCTKVMLSSIQDKRFLYVVNNKNIGGPLNLIKALTLARGTYAFVCLDKDILDNQRIPDLIKSIDAHPEVVFGYCSLNLKSQCDDFVYDQGYQSLLNMAYLSKHPSGIFYKTEVLKKVKKINEIFKESLKFAFYTDIICGEMAMYGKSMIINLPLFYTETKEDCAQTPSFTYNDNDLFFAPIQRITEFNIYSSSISHLNLKSNELFKLIKKVYLRTLISSTFDYKSILNDESVCEHYGISTREINTTEIIKIDLLFSSNFLNKRLPLSYSSKLFICVIGHLRILLKIFKS